MTTLTRVMTATYVPSSITVTIALHCRTALHWLRCNRCYITREKGRGEQSPPLIASTIFFLGSIPESLLKFTMSESKGEFPSNLLLSFQHQGDMIKTYKWLNKVDTLKFFRLCISSVWLSVHVNSTPLTFRSCNTTPPLSPHLMSLLKICIPTVTLLLPLFCYANITVLKSPLIIHDIAHKPWRAYNSC